MNGRPRRTDHEGAGTPRPLGRGRVWAGTESGPGPSLGRDRVWAGTESRPGPSSELGPGPSLGRDRVWAGTERPGPSQGRGRRGPSLGRDRATEERPTWAEQLHNDQSYIAEISWNCLSELLSFGCCTNAGLLLVQGGTTTTTITTTITEIRLDLTGTLTLIETDTLIRLADLTDDST